MKVSAERPAFEIGRRDFSSENLQEDPASPDRRQELRDQQRRLQRLDAALELREPEPHAGIIHLRKIAAQVRDEVGLLARVQRPVELARLAEVALARDRLAHDVAGDEWRVRLAGRRRSDEARRKKKEIVKPVVVIIEQKTEKPNLKKLPAPVHEQELDDELITAFEDIDMRS